MTFDAHRETIGGITINPGTGPVDDATESNAVDNMAVLVQDVHARRGVTFAVERLPERDEDGRYGFRIFVEGEEHLVDMPGLPVEQVRYLGKPQDIWHFPRLYVDDSSWVWKFAVEAIVPDVED